MQPVKTSVFILLGLLLLAGCASTQENDILEKLRTSPTYIDYSNNRTARFLGK